MLFHCSDCCIVWHLPRMLQGGAWTKGVCGGEREEEFLGLLTISIGKHDQVQPTPADLQRGRAFQKVTKLGKWRNKEDNSKVSYWKGEGGKGWGEFGKFHNCKDLKLLFAISSLRSTGWFRQAHDEHYSKITFGRLSHMQCKYGMEMQALWKIYVPWKEGGSYRSLQWHDVCSS